MIGGGAGVGLGGFSSRRGPRGADRGSHSQRIQAPPPKGDAFALGAPIYATWLIIIVQFRHQLLIPISVVVPRVPHRAWRCSDWASAPSELQSCACCEVLYGSLFDSFNVIIVELRGALPRDQ